MSTVPPPPGRPGGDSRTSRCRTESAQVLLTAPSSTVSAAAEVMAPFIRTEPVGPERAERVWSVRYEPDGRQDLAGFEKIVQTPAGEPPTVLWVHHEHRVILVDSGTEEDFAAHLAARWIRKLLRLSHAARGEEIFLHAAFVSAGAGEGGRGVAIVGQKRAGKTSSLLAAMLNGAAFVANDDLSVYRQAAAWQGRGWPRSVSVREDTLPALGIRLDAPGTPAGGFRRLPVPAHGPVESAIGPHPQARFLFYPRELAALLRTSSVQSQAPLTALVFPRFADGDREPTRLTRLDPAQVAERLESQVTPDPVKRADFLRRHFPRAPAAGAAKLVDRLCTDIPGYELVQQFSDLRAGADHLATLLRA